MKFNLLFALAFALSAAVVKAEQPVQEEAPAAAGDENFKTGLTDDEDFKAFMSKMENKQMTDDDLQEFIKMLQEKMPEGPDGKGWDVGMNPEAGEDFEL